MFFNFNLTAVTAARSLLLVSVFVSRAAEMQNVGKCRALVAYDIVVAESLMVAVDIILIIRGGCFVMQRPLSL